MQAQKKILTDGFTSRRTEAIVVFWRPFDILLQDIVEDGFGRVVIKRWSTKKEFVEANAK